MIDYIVNIFRKYINPHWASVVGMILLGLILTIIFLLVEPQMPAANVKGKLIIQLMGLLGKTILAGGFLAFFLKSFQFIGIFRDEISKVIFGQDFLTKTTKEYKRQVWGNMTSSLYESSFSDIKDRIGNIIADKYIPKGLEFYHEDMTIIYEFAEVDASHLALIEKQTFKIRASPNEIEFGSEIVLWKEDKTDDRSDIEFVEFKIDGLDISKPPFANRTEEVTSEGIKKIIVSIRKNLNGKTQYQVTKYLRTIHSTKMNVYWKNEISRYTKNFELIITPNSTFEVDFVPFGLNIELKNIPHSDIRRHEDLLIPGEGYVIFVKNKTH
jgi:hypothetical protein